MPCDSSEMWTLSYLGLNTCCTRKRQEAWACPECRWPRRGVRQFDLHIQEKKPPSRSGLVSGVAWGGLFLAHEVLAGVLLDCVPSEDVAICPVYNGAGVRLLWVALRHRIQRVVRGGPESSYRRCDACDTVFYVAMGRQYVVGHDMGAGVIGCSQKGDLLVGAAVERRMVMEFGAEKCRRILRPLQVTEACRDAMPELPDYRYLW